MLQLVAMNIYRKQPQKNFPWHQLKLENTETLYLLGALKEPVLIEYKMPFCGTSMNSNITLCWNLLKNFLVTYFVTYKKPSTVFCQKCLVSNTLLVILIKLYKLVQQLPDNNDNLLSKLRCKVKNKLIIANLRKIQFLVSLNKTYNIYITKLLY